MTGLKAAAAAAAAAPAADTTGRLATLEDQLKKVNEILQSAEEAEELAHPGGEVAVDKRLTDVYTHYDGKSKRLNVLTQHKDAIDFIDSADFDAQPWLNPALLVDADLLRQADLEALQGIGLPKLSARPLIERLKTVEVVVVAFEDKPKPVTDFAGEMEALRTRFFIPPTVRGGQFNLDVAKTADFRNYIKTTYGLDDVTPVVSVLQSLNPADFTLHIDHVTQIRAIRENLIQSLTEAQVLQSQHADLQYGQLQAAHQHYHMQEQHYRIAWNQHELDMLHAWLRQQASVPPPEKLNDFPDTLELPGKDRLTALQKIVEVSVDLDAAHITHQVQAAGQLIPHLPGTEAERAKFLQNVSRELDNAWLTGIPDTPDNTAATQFKQIATELKLPEDMWIHLYYGARYSSAPQWLAVVDLIVNHNPDVVMAVHTDGKDIHLAKSGYDSDTIHRLRELKAKDMDSYQAFIRTQTARAQQIAQEMADTVTWAVKSKGRMYSVEELKLFPDDHHLIHVEWLDPMRAFHARFANTSIDKDGILRRAKFLVQFTPDEYNELVPLLNDNKAMINSMGVIPTKKADFDQKIKAAGLEPKLELIHEYVAYDGLSAANNVNALKAQAIALHESGIHARSITMGHIDIVDQGIDPSDLLAQRGLARQLPVVYGEISEPASTHRWLMAHGDLLVAPAELMSVDHFQAMHQFVDAVILPTTGDVAIQQQRLEAARGVEDLLQVHKQQLFTKLQTELGKTGSTAKDLVHSTGDPVDATAFYRFATNLGVTDPAQQTQLAKYLSLYPDPAFAPTIATQMEAMITAGIKPSQVTETQLTMASDKGHRADIERMLASATAHKDEYTHAYQSTYQKKVASKVSHFETRQKGFTKAKDFATKYAPPGGRGDGYDETRYQTQKTLKATFEATRGRLRGVDVPAAVAPPSTGDTPLHDELQGMQPDLSTGATLTETKVSLEEWVGHRLVTTSEELQPLVQGIYDQDLPDDAAHTPDLGTETAKIVSDTVEATRSHKTGPRDKEITDLQDLAKEKSPQEFHRKFKAFETKHSMAKRKVINGQMLELQQMFATDDPMDLGSIPRVKEIITDWVTDHAPATKNDFYLYISVNSNGGGGSKKAPLAVTKLNAVLGVGDDPETVKAALKTALATPQVKAAHAFAQQYENLEAEATRVEQIRPGFTAPQKKQLDDLREEIKALREKTTLPGAEELGMEEIGQKIGNVDDTTPHEELLRIGRELKGTTGTGEETDHGSPIGRAHAGIEQITSATAVVNQEKVVVTGAKGLGLGQDYEEGYVERQDQVIGEFDRDCPECTNDPVWKKDIKLQKHQMVDGNGYPDPAKIQPVHDISDEQLPKLEKGLRVFGQIQSQPERVAEHVTRLEEELELTTRTVTLVRGDAKPLFESGYIATVQRFKNDATVMRLLRTKAQANSGDVTGLPTAFEEFADSMALLHTGHHPITGATLKPADQQFLTKQLYYDVSEDRAPAFNDVVTATKTVAFGGGSIPLRETDGELLKRVVDVDIGSAQSIVLADLVRLRRAGVPIDLVQGMITQPMAVGMVKALRPQPLVAPAAPAPGAPAPDTLTDDDVVKIVGRLQTHHELIPDMMAQVDQAMRDGATSKMLKERSMVEVTDTLPPVMHQRHMLRIGLVNEFSHAVRNKRGHIIPAVVQNIEDAIRYYAEQGVDTALVWNKQAELDSYGLTKDKCISVVRLYTKNAEFLDPVTLPPADPGFSPLPTKISTLFSADITNAPLSVYQVLGHKFYNVMKSQVSRTAGNLMWVYVMNRVNLYLDDIAYNEGKGLISALTGTGAAADELLLMSGLTRREHLVEDIVRYFGGEAAAIYKEYFEGQLGDIDTLMTEYVMPAASLTALAVQSPVTVYEVGTLMKLRPDGPDRILTKWNIAYSMSYAMIRVIADIGRTQSRLNKQVITAVDPAAKRVAAWLDEKAPGINDTVRPEDRYYQKLWESIFNGWNEANDYLGTSVGARVLRAPAELVEDLFFFRIYGGAVSPLINLSAKQYELIYRSGWLINDWARRDFEGMQYGAEGWAELLDLGMGLNSSQEGSWKSTLR